MKWGAVLLLLLPIVTGRAQEVHIPLNDGWSFSQVGKERWYGAEVPGVVHTDLLRHGLIPDFMRDGNIDKVQWIEYEDWTYRRTITVDRKLMRHRHLDLVFKGLDTFAEVYLNDSLIGKADNMFRTWVWPVKAVLRQGENEVKVVFRSPIMEGAKLRDAYGVQLPHDSDPSGVSPYMRKAAYQFGWDFCPRLVTMGIWKEVELHGWNKARITGIDMHPVGDRSLTVSLRTKADRCYRKRIKVFMNDTLVADRKVGTCPTRIRSSGTVWFTIDDLPIKLWWPVGLGEQYLYDVRVELFIAGKREAVEGRWYGFADVALDQAEDSIGRAFTVKVGGVPVFAKGCNLVPPHIIPSAISDSAWVAQVRHMQAAGMNMVRVWSGGIYPSEAFYHACDTAGILVWQDLMFGNMVAPTSGFLANVDRELEELQRSWGGHPCLAIVCGNNELDVAWKHWGWQERYGLHAEDSVRVERDNREFFHTYLPARLQGPYTPTSPLSNWGSEVGLRSGDLHYWGVWHGDSAFSSFANNVGRFVSEYGFQSYPDSALLAKYIHPDSLYLGSPALARLHRSYKTDRPIWEAIERELGEEPPTTLGAFIEAGQRVQAKAYGMAIAAHFAARPHCMGTLLWQLNDPWPGPSWSIIDVEGNPKPAYQVVKRLNNAHR